VATAVTKGDLTRSIQIEAAGEVAALSDTINQMIGNLRETTRKNTEQDWLKTNLARFSSMLQGQKDLDTVSSLIMSELTPLVSAHHGAFFLMDSDGGSPMLKLTATYAYRERKGVPNRFWLGEGLVGQCALEKKSILLTMVPPDYIQISSGLGEATPLNIIVLPIRFEGDVRAVIELASFHPFSEIHQIFLDQLSGSIGVVLNVMLANLRTEQLLEQSQKLTQELQNQSSELTDRQQALKLTNSALERQALELEEKARLLAEQNVKVEEKNREVEQARKSLEEKAEQMASLSKYKSEFLANMSHELRTPLNSLLVLAKVLCENKNGTLTEKDLEYARTIHGSGVDLLHLINEVLDLSKMEAGKLHIEYRDAALADIAEALEKSFKPLASEKELAFAVEQSADLPMSMTTDPQRLDQILRNLLDNAFKFTESGSVTLKIARAATTDAEGATLAGGTGAITFSVVDTGIGIKSDKQQIIFEAFQQADGSTSRNYGGTGLGLSISRELAHALGGKIIVHSKIGEGSTFTLYLPAPLHLQQSIDHNAAPVMSATREDAAVFDASPIAYRKALVVDDDPRNLYAMRILLERYQMEVLQAENGREALRLIAQNPGVAVVLMDIMMPGMDGFETIRRIRTDLNRPELPIIAVTAKAFPEDRERRIQAGASDYLAKPIDEKQLIVLIGSSLGN
jgi:signal transduction histidine kinase